MTSPSFFASAAAAAPRSAAADSVTKAGAIAGAAFPLMIYVPAVLTRAIYGAIPFFGMLTAISALLGAGFGSLVLKAAKRAPEIVRQPAALEGGSILDEVELPRGARERVR